MVLHSEKCGTVRSPLDLPSNEIGLRFGSDDSEPREIVRWARRFLEKDDCRFSIAVNTLYPELAGGYYQNFALIRLVQKSLRAIKCSVIVNEVFSQDSPCPDEIDGNIEYREDYVVVRNRQCVAALLMWSFDTGGGSEFLRDAIVLDFVGGEGLAAELFDAVESECKNHVINVVRHSRGS